MAYTLKILYLVSMEEDDGYLRPLPDPLRYNCSTNTVKPLYSVALKFCYFACKFILSLVILQFSSFH